jgi:heterodisulfide reductase subunit A
VAAIISKQKWKIEPITSVINKSKCNGCGVCVSTCPYGAIKREEGKSVRIVTASCHGCGTCVAECSFHAITQMHFTDAQIMAQIHAALQNRPEEKILAFLCNWCSYAGADLAGISRCEYPASVRVIRVMCSGRVSKEFIVEAFRLGAGMVLIGACHLPYDCHYINGNHRMKIRADALKTVLIKLGMSPERFRMEYVSAAEGIHYAEIIGEIDKQRKALGNRVIEETEKLKPALERMLKTGFNEI